MRPYLKETVVGVRSHLRHSQALFWEFTVPLAMMLLFSFRIPSGGEITPVYSRYLLAGMLGLAIMSTGLYGVSAAYAVDSAGGRLKLLRLSPYSLSPYFVGLGMRHYLVSLLQAAAIVGVAWLIGFRVSATGAIEEARLFTGGEVGQGARLVLILAYYTLGVAAFIAIGLMIAVIARQPRGYANILYMSMLFLGNVFYQAPPAVGQVTRWLPLGVFVEGMRVLFAGETTGLLVRSLTLLAWVVGPVLVVRWLYRPWKVAIAS